MRYSTLIIILLTLPGCGGGMSSHTITTSNGKISASFKNKAVEDVCQLLSEKAGPLKGYSAEIPADLKGKKLTFEIAKTGDVDVIRKALADATGYKVEIDVGGRTIKFLKP